MQPYSFCSCCFYSDYVQLLSAAHQMSHCPTVADFRIGIEAAVRMRQSTSAFAFLQRIQHYYQQRQMSESSLDHSLENSVELDSEAFYSVMTCGLQTTDCAIVQTTFDELKATVGLADLENRAWIMLLQVSTQVLADSFCGML